MHAVLVAVVATLGGELLPVPTGDELAKAEKTIQDVFGDDLKGAKTPKEKTELAQKMVETAAGSEPAGKYALLQQARNLAIAGGDAAIGIRAIQDLIAVFAPQKRQDAASWASEGHRLWNLASDQRPPEKLGTRVAAAECYLRAVNGLEGFQRAAVEKRLRELGWEREMTPAEVMACFPLATWKVKGDTLTGQFHRVYDDDGWAMAKARTGVKSLELSLEMMVPKDLAIRVDVDGVQHVVIFGSHKNTRLTWWSGKDRGMRPFTIRDTGTWHKLSAELRDRKLTFSLDGKTEREIPMPGKQQEGYTVRVGFGHHIGHATVRRVRLGSR